MDFSNAGLAAVAGRDPWARLRQFDAGDPSEIWDLAVAFRAAAGDQQVAMEQATAGFRYVEAGYRVDDDTPLDVAGELAEARAALGDDGTKLYEVAKVLESVAEDLSSRTSSARDEVRQLETALAARRAAYNRYLTVPAAGGMTDADDTEIKALHDEAVELVEIAGQHVTTSVEAYDAFLHTCVSRMAGLGYVPGDDLDQGPGDVTFTAAGAAADAGLVSGGLATQPPSAEGAGQIADGSEAIALLEAKMAAGAALTPAEKTYIDAWFAGVGEDGLAALPAYAAAVPSPEADFYGPVEDRTMTTALVTPISNLIMRLSESNIDGEGINDVPAEVTALSDTEIGWVDPETGKRMLFEGSGPRYDTVDGPVSITGLDRWNSFADLMATATVTGSQPFVTSLGDDALRVIRQLDAIAEDDTGYLGLGIGSSEYGPDITASSDPRLVAATQDHSGVSAMLELVAKNTDASQHLLLDPSLCTLPGDPANLDVLLGTKWTSEDGAIGVLGAATAPIQPNADLAFEAARSAEAVLSLVASDPERWRETVPKGSEMSTLVADVGANWIGAFSHPNAWDPQPAEQTPDGNYHSEFGLDPGDGAAFMKFIGLNGDGEPFDGGGDPDIIKMYGAAQAYSIENLAEHLTGTSASNVDAALQSMVNLDALIVGADYAAAMEDNADADAAFEEAALNRQLGIQFVERMLTSTIGLVPGGSLVQSAIGMAFDQFVATSSLTSGDVPGMVDAGAILAENIKDYSNRIDVMILAAKQLAGIDLGTPEILDDMDGPLPLLPSGLPDVSQFQGADQVSFGRWVDLGAALTYVNGFGASESLKELAEKADSLWKLSILQKFIEGESGLDGADE